jgi:hypothetical protein
MRRISRIKELACVIFGHQWDEVGFNTIDGILVEEYEKCSLCKLRNHQYYLVKENAQDKPCD